MNIAILILLVLILFNTFIIASLLIKYSSVMDEYLKQRQKKKDMVDVILTELVKSLKKDEPSE